MKNQLPRKRAAFRLPILSGALLSILLSSCATAPSENQASAELLDKNSQGLRGKLRQEAYNGSYYIDRYTYPTGNFDARWILQSEKQLDAMAKGLPDGMTAMSRDGLRGNLPDGFSLIGPLPMTSNGTGTGVGAVAGRVNSIATHPTNAAEALIATDGGGIWKTTNCCTTGTTWRSVTDSPLINSIAISDIARDPNNPDVVYAGTGDFRFGTFMFGAWGVLKSINGGETWDAVGTGSFTPFFPPSANGFPQYQAVSAVRVDPNNSNRVIAGTKTGVFMSYDAGVNWSGPCAVHGFASQRMDVTDLELRDLGTDTAILAAIGTRGFATTVQPDLNNNGGNGVYGAAMPTTGCPSFALKNNGWPTVTGAGAPQTTVGRIALAVAPTNQDVVYAQVSISQSSATVQGYYKSTDGGETWSTVGNIDAAGCSNANVQSWYNLGIDVSPFDSQVFHSSAVDQFRSATGGSSHTNVTCGYSRAGVHVDNHSRGYVAGQPNALLIGNDGGVWFTADSSVAAPSFISLNQTLPTIEFYSGDITANFATATTGTIGAVGGAQDNGTSVGVWTGTDRAAKPWPLRLGGDGIYARIEPVLAQRWYMSSQNGSIRASTTGPTGATTATINPPASLWTASERKSFLTPFEIYKYGDESTCPAATGCQRMIIGTQRVWESLVGGIPNTSWYANSPDLTDAPGDPGPAMADRAFVNQLTYSFNDPSIAIAGTNDGNVWFGFGLGGGSASLATWVKLANGNVVLPNRPILDVVTDAQNPRIGYAAVGGFDQNTPSTPGHVFEVSCTGNCASFTWRDVSGNLPNIPANSIMTNPLYPKQVFVGTDWGLFFTNDVSVATPTWTRMNAGLPNVMIWDMAIDRGFTTLAVFTRSRGAWVMPLPQLNADGVFANGFE